MSDSQFLVSPRTSFSSVYDHSRDLLQRLGAVLSDFVAARSVAADLEARRRPDPDALRRLGLEALPIERI